MTNLRSLADIQPLPGELSGSSRSPYPLWCRVQTCTNPPRFLFSELPRCLFCYLRPEDPLRYPYNAGPCWEIRCGRSPSAQDSPSGSPPNTPQDSSSGPPPNSSPQASAPQDSPSGSPPVSPLPQASASPQASAPSQQQASASAQASAFAQASASPQAA